MCYRLCMYFYWKIRNNHQEKTLLAITFINESLDNMSHAIVLLIPPSGKESNLHVNEALVFVSPELLNNRVQDVLNPRILYVVFVWNCSSKTYTWYLHTWPIKRSKDAWIVIQLIIMVHENGKFRNIRIQSNINIKFSSTNSHAFYEAFIDLHGICSQKGLPYEILRLRKERERERGII